MKPIILFFLISRLHIAFTQCNISSLSTFSYYSRGSSNGLVFQSAISATSIYGKACSGTFASPLTSTELATAYHNVGPLPKINIFPNPVESGFNIAWNGIELNCMVEIANPLGAKLKSFHRDKSESTSRIDIQGLSPGFYILIISDTEHRYQYSTKLLKL